MNKQSYLTPLLEVIQMDRYLEKFCISHDDYTVNTLKGSFDQDSD